MDRTFSISNDEELPSDESFTKAGNKAFEIIGGMNVSDEDSTNLHVLGESTFVGDLTLIKENSPNVSDDTMVVIPKFSLDEISSLGHQVDSVYTPILDVSDDATHSKPNLNGTYTIEKYEEVTPEHERHHVRHHTVTLEAGGITKEVSDFMKELVASHPNDFMDVLQTKMTEFALAKEVEWRNDYEKSLKKLSAVNEMKFSSAVSVIERENENKHNAVLPQIDTKMDAELVMAMKDRDQFRDQAISTMRTANERAKEQEYFMEKAKRYENVLKQLDEEGRQSKEVAVEIRNRYDGLLHEAEQQLADVEGALAHYKQQNDQDSIALRLRVRQQEMKIKSHQGLIDALTREKLELITMCEELVQQFDRKKVPENIISPIRNTNDDLIQSGDDQGTEDEAFVDAPTELLSPESQQSNNSQNEF